MFTSPAPYIMYSYCYVVELLNRSTGTLKNAQSDWLIGVSVRDLFL